MGNSKKTGVSILVIVFIILVAGYIATNYLSGRIQDELNSALGEKSSHEKIDVDLFAQNIHLRSLKFRNRGTEINTPKLSFKGLSYLQYLKNGKIVFDEVSLAEPEIIIAPSQDSVSKSKVSFKKEIEVKVFKTSKATLELKGKDSAGNKLFSRIREFEVSGIKVDSSTINQMVPFNYNGYNFKVDSLRINITPEHYIASESIDAKNGRVEVRNFKIIPNYGPSVFDQKILYEKDRISLKVNQIRLDSLSFSFRNDTLYLQNPVMGISGGDLQIYRNKTLPDNPKMIPLYSQMLRQSPVKLDLKEVSVDSTRIVYEEKVKADRQVARISFNNVDGKIDNLTNVGLDQKDLPRTKITASADFMDTTPVEIDWSFNAANQNEKFLFSGSFGRVSGDSMNAFLSPSMGLAAEGSINSVAFTFTGNDDMLSGDVQVEYENFRIEILKDQSRETSKFLSAIANLFVDNDGLSEENNIKDIQVNRDKAKSFWNYVWLGLKKGVLDALVQI
ncbi:hypothetical protein [Salinimicrobium gaetbulicola]|uniref:DUF748 domain-containing protein n=1 Tax=Salinimicrobium gaetbulicola TaxID=999702 RepID=A0ABW3IHF1_9FLAO